MGSRTHNRSNTRASLGLILSAIYLNLTFDAVNASDHHSYGHHYGGDYGSGHGGGGYGGGYGGGRYAAGGGYPGAYVSSHGAGGGYPGVYVASYGAGGGGGAGGAYPGAHVTSYGAGGGAGGGGAAGGVYPGVYVASYGAGSGGAGGGAVGGGYPGAFVASYGGGSGAAIPPLVIPWGELLTRLAVGGFTDQGQALYGLGSKQGFADNNGYYNDLLAQKNAYDVGKGYGNGYDYGRGSVVGSGYRDLGGRNRGHTASGFSNSYRKDESGDRSSYYDDGLGHNGKISYAAHDNRFRDQGGALGRGGYHNTNLKKYGTGGYGGYGETRQYASGGLGHNAGGRYRYGRVLTNRTGLYVVPMPSTLYVDVPSTPVPSSSPTFSS